ncbi:hypothetical protein EIL50_00480 [bacterium NHP-B]|nr:hypothetical protein EIL50_00480 [bacterium NHP-B]
MKKISLLALSSALVGAAFVGHADDHGFKAFLGVDGGFVNTRSVVDKTGSGMSSTSDMAVTGGDVGLFVGVMHVFDNSISLGLEGTAAWIGSTGRIQDLDQPRAMNVLQQKNAYGINALVGFACPAMHPFIRMGWSNSKFDASYSAENLEGWGARQVSKSGFLLGIGADFCVYEGIYVGGSLDHTWYGNFSYETDGSAPVNVKMSPETDKLTVRLKFVF